MEKDLSEQDHWERLHAFLQRRNEQAPLAIAFSGGLDSRFLAHAAQKAGCDVVLYHATGAHVPQEESRYALAWAAKRHLPIRVFTVDVCHLEHVKDNSHMRCYYCKSHLLNIFTKAAVAQGRQLCDGTNVEDMGAHRPGLRALQEYSVLSPLMQCAFHKETIRAVAVYTGLENSSQQASPCLLTRLHYDMPVDTSLLLRIADAEEALRKGGVTQCRLRICPEPILQVTQCSLSSQETAGILADFDFHDVEVVVEERISGFFDRR